MHKLSHQIVKHYKAIIVIFIVLSILSCVAIPFVVTRLNSEVMRYLPHDTDTYKGIEFLSKNFGIEADNMVGVTGASKDEIYDVAHKLDHLYYNGKNLYIATEEQLNSDNFNDKKVITQNVWRYSEFVSAGLIFADSQTQKKIESLFYSAGDSPEYFDDTYVFMLMINFSSSSNMAFKTLDFIENDIVKNSVQGTHTFYQFGSTKMAKDIFENTIGEVWAYTLVGFAIVLVVLLLFTKSFIDPIIIIITLAISILLNIGSNIIFKTNSIITFASSSLLQVALSVDYAVFLIHAYRDESKSTPDKKTALENAIPRAFKSVFASAMTTLGGFIALYFMHFGIGPDMGGVLAKGILMSFLCVMFLQPALMVVFSKQLEGWKHKTVDLKFRKPVKTVIKFRSVIVVILIIAIFPIVLFQSDLKLNYFNFVEYDEHDGKVYDMVDTMAHQIIVAVPFDIDDKENIDKQYEYIEKLNNLKEKDGTYTIEFSLGFASVLPKTTLNTILQNSTLKETLVSKIKPFVNGGYTIYTIGLSVDEFESQDAFMSVENITKLTKDVFNNENYYITGLSQGGRDFQRITPNDFQRVSIASALIILIILLLTFRSVKHSLLLILLIEIGIWINLCLQRLTGQTINFMSYIIISSIQLGATVDYAILITSKYRDLRKRMLPAHASYYATTSSVMSVLTSATILAGACFSVQLMSTVLIVSEVTALIGRGAIISALITLFVLPSFLAFFDRPSKGGSLDIPNTDKLSKRHIINRDKKKTDDVYDDTDISNIDYENVKYDVVNKQIVDDSIDEPNNDNINDDNDELTDN